MPVAVLALELNAGLPMGTSESELEDSVESLSLTTSTGRIKSGVGSSESLLSGLPNLRLLRPAMILGAGVSDSLLEVSHFRVLRWANGGMSGSGSPSDSELEHSPSLVRWCKPGRSAMSSTDLGVGCLDHGRLLFFLGLRPGTALESLSVFVLGRRAGTSESLSLSLFLSRWSSGGMPLESLPMPSPLERVPLALGVCSPTRETG